MAKDKSGLEVGMWFLSVVAFDCFLIGLVAGHQYGIRQGEKRLNKLLDQIDLKVKVVDDDGNVTERIL